MIACARGTEKGRRVTVCVRARGLLSLSPPPPLPPYPRSPLSSLRESTLTPWTANVSAIIPPSCPRSPLSFLREPTSTPWTTGLEHAREHERGDHCTEGVVGAARPQGAPGRSRRAQRAQRALPEPGSVPGPSVHVSASSAAPPAIEAGCDASAGRGGAMRLNTTTQSDQPHPARASSIGALRCWLGTTPSRRPVGKIHDRAQIRTKAASTSPEWIPGLRLPRRGAQAGGGPPATGSC